MIANSKAHMRRKEIMKYKWKLKRLFPKLFAACCFDIFSVFKRLYPSLMLSLKMLLDAFRKPQKGGKSKSISLILYRKFSRRRLSIAQTFVKLWPFPLLTWQYYVGLDYIVWSEKSERKTYEERRKLILFFMTSVGDNFEKFDDGKCNQVRLFVPFPFRHPQKVSRNLRYPHQTYSKLRRRPSSRWE